MEVLMLLIVIDIVIGFLGGFTHKDLNSKVGLVGLIKHSVVILLVLAFQYISDLYSLGEYYNLFIIFYLLQYILSILENALYLGVPVPEFLLVRLKDYQDKGKLKKWEKKD